MAFQGLKQKFVKQAFNFEYHIFSYTEKNLLRYPTL